MQRIREIWGGGVVGKIWIGCGGLVGLVVLCALCTAILGAFVPKRPATTATSATTAAGAPTSQVAVIAAPTSTGVPGVPTATTPPEPTVAPTEVPPTIVPPTDVPTPVPEPTAAPTAAVLPKVGEDVKVGDVRWKILEVKDEGDTLKSDKSFPPPKKTAGKWLRVRFEIENQSTDTLNLTGVDVKDNKGRTFKSSTDAIFFIPNEEQCVFKQLSANVPATCQVIYELPADAAGLQAIIGDLKLFGAKDGAVDLGQ